MCEFNTKITIAQLFRLTVKTLLSKTRLSPGNSIVFGIAATLRDAIKYTFDSSHQTLFDSEP